MNIHDSQNNVSHPNHATLDLPQREQSQHFNRRSNKSESKAPRLRQLGHRRHSLACPHSKRAAKRCDSNAHTHRPDRRADREATADNNGDAFDCRLHIAVGAHRFALLVTARFINCVKRSCRNSLCSFSENRRFEIVWQPSFRNVWLFVFEFRFDARRVRCFFEIPGRFF